jgi:pilus assembly protein CpaB
MRAFALRVDVASGVSGFLRPGDRVDVYWTGKVETGPSGQVRSDVTKLIEAGVHLIAVDQTASGDLDGALVARTVTVAASPQQVAALAQAQTTGRLSLSLVGNGDDVVAEAIEVDQYRLLGIEQDAAPVRVEKKEKKVCTIRTRRGAEVVDIPIPCSD